MLADELRGFRRATRHDPHTRLSSSMDTLFVINNKMSCKYCIGTGPLADLLLPKSRQNRENGLSDDQRSHDQSSLSNYRSTYDRVRTVANCNVKYSLPHSCADGLRLLSYSDQEFVMGKYRKLAMFSISLDAITTEWEPVGQSKIDCFVEVKL